MRRVQSEKPSTAGDAGEDFDTEAARLRNRFVDHVWLSLAAFSLVTVVCLPLRAVQFHIWTWGTTANIALAAAFAAASPFQRRLSDGLRQGVPVAALMIGASIATLRNGLQDIGLVLLLLGTVIIAMLFSRRTALACFALTCLVLVLAAAGFVSGRLAVRLDQTYDASMVGWAFALATFLSLGSLAVHGIITYREASLALSRRVARQRDEIAEQRDRIAVLATRDVLTGLPNRRLARDRLEAACRQAARAGESVAVLFIDLDRFKSVNDSLGHEVGDQVLTIVAARITGAIRAADTAARLGGDEFLVILGRDAGPAAALEVAAKLTEEIERPIPWSDDVITLGASIGVAIFPRDADTPDGLLRHADRAMYGVKRLGDDGGASA